jgi:hypothetical protein
MTEIGQCCVYLAAMMGLMIEEVRHGQLPRPADFGLCAADNPHEILVEPGLPNAGSPSGNVAIGANSFGTEFGKMCIEPIALRAMLPAAWPAVMQLPSR